MPSDSDCKRALTELRQMRRQLEENHRAQMKDFGEKFVLIGMLLGSYMERLERLEKERSATD